MSLYDGIRASGGRRFVLAVGAGMVNTLLLIGGYIDPTIYRDLTIGTVAVYIAGNTAQKFANGEEGK